MLLLFCWIVVLALSLAVLIIASDKFTGAAEKVGIFFGIPQFIVGVTIIAIGTSLPELVSSILAVARDSSEFVVGNVLGSNIANIFLVLGITAIVAGKMRLQREVINVDLPMLAGSAFLLALMIWDGEFRFLEAVLCIACFVVFVLYTISCRKKEAAESDEDEAEAATRKRLSTRTILALPVCAVCIMLGANYTVVSVSRIAEIVQVGKGLIAMTAVALGTSLPELMVTMSAARKGNPEMAVGNILGSNVVNALLVMGVAGMVGTLVIPPTILTVGLPTMVVATVLFFFATQERQVTKWEGWLFLIFYVLFLGKSFNLM